MKFRIVDTRFRILKGGKVSLAASVALVGGMLSLASVGAYASPCPSGSITVTAGSTSQYICLGGASTVTLGGDLSVSAPTLLENNMLQAVALQSNGNSFTFTNNHSMSVNDTTYNDDYAVLAIEDNMMNSSIVNDSMMSLDGSGTSLSLFGIAANDLNNSTITNSGTIAINSTGTSSGDVYTNGISVGAIDANSSIHNSGNITISDTTGRIGTTGIYAYSNAGTILSDGNISVNANGTAIGIAVGDVSSNFNNSSINSGTITNSGHIDVSSVDSIAVGIATAQNTGTITNSGTITADSNSSSSSSVWGGDANGMLTYTNFGTIKNSGIISVNAQNGSGFGMVTGINGLGANMIAYAQSEVNASRGSAHPTFMNMTNYEIATMSAAPANMTNTGTISITANGSAMGMGAKYNAVDSNITNSGTVSIHSGYGFGMFSAFNIGNLTNSGTINVDVNGTSNSNPFGNAVGMVGYLNVATVLNSGSIDVNSTTTAAGIVVGLNGIPSGGPIGFSGSGTITNSGTITVNGDYGATGISATKYNGNNSTISNDGNISVTSSLRDATGIDVGTNGGQFGTGTITNSGTISATATNTAQAWNQISRAYGILVSDNYGDIKNTVTGDINATAYNKAYGIKISNNNAGTITNQGHITVSSSGEDAFGIMTRSTNSGTILNSGTITTNANYTSIGMGTWSQNDGNITNSGTITANSTNGRAYGIYVEQNNNGNITNTVSGDINATAYSDAHGIYIERGYNNGTITNAGTITVTSTNSDAEGIIVDGNNNGNIINSGTITANGYSWSTGIGLWSSNDGNITNSGHIHVSSVNNNAYGIYIESDSNGNITNSGDINATASNATAEGIHIGGWLNPSATITNTGTINVDGSSAAYGLKINNAYLATVENNGTISAKINGELDANAYSIYSEYFDDSVVINNGTLVGNIYLSGTNGGIATLTNHGIIELPYNANGDHSAYIQNFTNASDGTLGIAINTGADGNITSNYSQLHTQNATLANGSSLHVNVMTLEANQALLQNKTFAAVVSADNNLTVNIDQLHITDNSALLNFTAVLEDNGLAIDLTTGQASTIHDTTVAGFGDKNAQGAAAVLDKVNENLDNHPGMQNYVAALNGLSTQGQVAHAVASTTGEVSAAATGTMSHLTGTMQNIVETRQRQMSGLGGGLSGGDAVVGDQQVWIKPFISFGNQKNKDDQSGFKTNAKGFGIGFDNEFMTDNRLGVAVFYSTSNVDMSSVSQTNDMTNWTALVYGSTPLRALGKNTQFMYQVGYSTQTNKTSREIYPTYETASANYTSTAISADLKLMGGYAVSKDFDVRPIVEYNYRHFMNPSYNESGAGALDLQVQSATIDQSIATVGAITEYKVDAIGKVVADIRAGYNFNHDQKTVSSNYEGATDFSFQTKGIDNGGLVYNAGIGYELDGKNSSIDFMFNTQGEGSGFNNNIISAKYVYKF